MADNSSTPRTTNATILEKQSLDFLSDLSIVHLCTCVWSVAGLVTNSIVILVIYSTKSFRHKSHFIIVSHSVSETVFCLTTFAEFSRRYSLFVLNKTDITSQLTCLIVQTPLLLATQASYHFLFFLGVDRLFALTKPIVYKKLKTFKYVLLVNCCCWGLALIKTPFIFVDYDGRDLAYCTYTVGVSLKYRSVESAITRFVVAATATIYLIAASTVAVKYRSKKWLNDEQRSAWAREIQLNYFKMMITVGLVYLICWGMGVAVYAWLGSMASRWTPYSGFFFNTCPVTHLFVYLVLGQQFGKEFRRIMLCRSETAVQSLSTS